MSDPVEDLEHVLDNVLHLDSVSQAGLSHFGINNIFDLMFIEPRQDLQEEFIIGTTTEGGGYIHKLPAMTIRQIETLQSWYALQPLEFSDVDWLSLDQATFRRFSYSKVVHRTIKAEEQEPDTNPTPSIPSPPSHTPNREVESFQRSIKRSPADYNKFKDDSRWKQWPRTLRLQQIVMGSLIS
jgi:hypothetical protein